jgi:peptidoglycan/LPS O-acetylase OafA/YrhL
MMGGPNRLVFLDGLRGWAALAVVGSHLFQMWMFNPDAMHIRGFAGLLDVINSSPLGVAMDGALAIHIFFCISGVALSYPIITSSTPWRTASILALHRYPRLTLPILASCLGVYALWLSGGFVNVEAGLRSNSTWLTANYRFDPHFADMLSFALWRIYFDYELASSWNSALWTMPIELLGSFVIFAVVVAVPRWARVILAGIAALAFADFYLCGFFVGILISDLIAARRLGRGAIFAGAALLVIALVAAIMARSPHVHVTAFATIWGRNLIGAAIVAGCAMLPSAQAFLGNATSRFLGAVSFSLYIVHIPIICSLSSALYLALEPRLPWGPLVILVAASTIAVSLTAAAIFHSIVEVRLGIVKRWVVRAVDAMAAAKEEHRASRSAQTTREAIRESAR